MEKTLILLKPDAIEKNLIGEIVSRFEKAKMKVLGMKMVHIDEEFAKGHYPLDEEWARGSFENTKKVYEEKGEEVPFTDHMHFGQTIQKHNVDYLTRNPVVAIVLEGENAITSVRELLGATEPKKAQSGTVRGDFGEEDSYAQADKESRAVMNLVHASDSIENALREISHWFSETELFNYEKEIKELSK